LNQLKPRIRLDEAATPEGGCLSLDEDNGAFVISHDGDELMHSNDVASEILLGNVGVASIKGDATQRVLIGGLGLGFTLRSVLDSVGRDTMVEVVELMAAVVEWNRTHLAQLNGALLEDSRVTIKIQDVTRSIRMAKPETYDAILLDVDNGPFAMVAEANSSLYTDIGIETLLKALKPGGRAVVWSAGPNSTFENRLEKARVKFSLVSANAGKGVERAPHLLYVLEPSGTAEISDQSEGACDFEVPGSSS
jgi:spermidine synthase